MQNIQGTTKLFLDSGNPLETKQILDRGFMLDGQTTNPSLVAKSPLFQQRVAKGGVAIEELFSLYKETVLKIHKYIPTGSLSVEVYAGADSTVDDLVSQAHMMKRWFTNPCIKLPITSAGLQAAHILVKEGTNVNMTLCFTQEQAMAVHQATLGAKPGQVYVSPFIGRLDDQGKNGVDLIRHIVQHYKNVASNVQVLSASIRSVEHIKQVVQAGTHIMTVPFKVFDLLAETTEENALPVSELEPIPFQKIDYTADWEGLNIKHELTDSGLATFKKDWDDLLLTN
jgi:transaldolase